MSKPEYVGIDTRYEIPTDASFELDLDGLWLGTRPIRFVTSGLPKGITPVGDSALYRVNTNSERQNVTATVQAFNQFGDTSIKLGFTVADQSFIIPLIVG